MVCLGKTGCHRAAHDLREVELRMAGIAAGHEDSADRITSPVPRTPFSQLIKPRILPEHGRKDPAHHEILHRAVGEGESVTFRVACRSLSVAWVLVFCL